MHSGLLDRLKKGSVICVSASTSPETAREMEAICNKRGIGLLDTPVVLGQEAADNGTLTVFCGGKADAFEKAKPALSAFGAKVMHVGPAGMGQLTKTANNMLLWACMAANYEVLSFAKKMGADIPKLVEALQFSSGANWSLETLGPQHGQMGREGHGRGARARAGRQGARAALRARRSADEGHEPGQDAGAAANSGWPARHWRAAAYAATMRALARGGTG